MKERRNNEENQKSGGMACGNSHDGFDFYLRSASDGKKQILHSAEVSVQWTM